jgi:hypothetical protein
MGLATFWASFSQTHQVTLTATNEWTLVNVAAHLDVVVIFIEYS